MKNSMMSTKIGVILLCAVMMSACTNATSATSSSTEDILPITATQTVAQSSAELVSVSLSDMVTFDEDDSNTAWTTGDSTSIELNGTSAMITGSGAEVKDGSVAITVAGTYVLSGALSDGQVVVDVEDTENVRLVLNGVNIHDNDSAAIYIKEADKVIITLQEGTENSLSDGATYVYADDATDEPSATLFSKADLTMNGTGKLSIVANYNDGITSKDDLKIMSGTIEVQAADDGIVGKDMVAVKDGKITITAEGDGIKSTNDKDADRGFIAIMAGTFDITAGNDGIQAETSLWMDGGMYNLVTGGGSENGEVKSDGMGQGPMGDMKQVPMEGMDPGAMGDKDSESSATTETTEATETTSAKGLKAGGDISINNGTFMIDAADDAVHSNSNVVIADGELTMMSGDDGIHADALVSITGGIIDITKSYEGIEGANIEISGGESRVVASDDGVNVAGGNDEATEGGGFGSDQFSASSTNLLTISGGTLTVDAMGDGLDSNGSIAMTGGTVIVNGPTNSGNGSLDFDGNFEQSGGLLIAAGSSGMVQAPSDSSSQYSIGMTFTQTQQAGTIVHLEDSEGNTILTFAPSKDYQSVVISSPDLQEGGSYTLYSGGTSTGSEVDGLYTDGEYVGGTMVVAFDISSSVTWLNESGVTTGQTSQGPGGGGGGRTRPEGGKSK